MEMFKDQETTTKLLQAQTHVWNHTFNFIHSMALKCAVQLGIPDIIHSHGQQPMTLSALVGALHVHPKKSNYVHRIMRILVHSGFFAVQKVDVDGKELEGYLLTESSRLLLKDHPFSLSAFVLLINDPIMANPHHYLSTWLQTDDPSPFKVANGVPIWEYADQEPGFAKSFNEGCKSDSLLIAALVTSKYQQVFEGLESLVDVAGGIGTMCKAIAKTFPQINCTVLDLPHVVAGLKGCNNLNYLAGDMFESIPSADAVLLKWILHDWEDEECVKLLKKCKEAITKEGKGGKVIVIDMVVGDQILDAKATEAQLQCDLEVMALYNARERTEQELAKLFLDAGFSDYKIKPVLGIRALIEVYP